MTPTNPRNAGRKATPLTKKRPFGCKLPPYLLDWMRAQPESMPKLIERAMVEHYDLHNFKKKTENHLQV